MASYVAAYGFGYIKTALVGGTYTKEQGMFFGGREPQKSHILLRDFFKEQFGKVPAKEIAWVDVHTGLGAQGRASWVRDRGFSRRKGLVLGGLPLYRGLYSYQLLWGFLIITIV